MKRVLIIAASALTVSVLVSSCLKDKGLENQQYGTVVNEVKAVAFPLAASSPVLGSVNSQTTSQEFQLPNITLEQAGAATSDVTVTVAVNNALVAEAIANDPSLDLTELPADAYTVSTTSVVVPAGAKFSDALKLVLPNTSLLDPTATYAIGFSITGVSAGYQVAANQKNVVVGFSIKNKFDGVYTLRARLRGWTAYGISDNPEPSYAYPEDFDFITVGANSNSMFSNYRGDNLLPAFTTGGGPTAFGATTPLFVFDVNTNALIDVRNTSPDDGRGRALELNPAVTDSRFDPATRTIYASFIMKQNGRPNQFFYDTLTYVKER
jgi:hypothetical protein